MFERTVTAVVLALSVASTAAQEPTKDQPRTEAKAPESLVDLDVEKAVQEGCKILLGMQEGETRGEWPYEGVYRDSKRRIPIGYRVGGTAISCLALLQSPGYAASEDRRGAVDRGFAFILASLKDPLMESGFEGTYDVRGWGHTYALLAFLRAKALNAIPERLAADVEKGTKHLVDVLEETAIKRNGGWNYSRPKGYDSIENPSSPFMTGPTVQALLLARSAGYKVANKVIDEALDSLERGRTDDGAYDYSSLTIAGMQRRKEMAEKSKAKTGNGQRQPSSGFMNLLPGAIGRMAVAEATLAMSGRGDDARLLEAVQDFFKHWQNLEVRRKQQGTHVEPYGVAPYYFIYAHYYVSQAIELLPKAEDREKYRDELRRTLAKVRETSGGWNDRVFPRSENFGTAMAIMALQMKELIRAEMPAGAK